jgi:hypothetical protein
MRARAFRPFVFLGLTVMTQSYTHNRHDVMFRKEHSRTYFALSPWVLVRKGPLGL